MLLTNFQTGFGDLRLDRKQEVLIEEFKRAKCCSINKIFGKYHEQKSCYRFLMNDRVREEILINNMKKTCAENVIDKDILVILDTTKIRLDRYKGRMTDFGGIGILSANQHHPYYGFLLHPLFVLDEQDGSPYGFADVVLFNRPMEPNPLSIKERKHLQWTQPLEEKESGRWVLPCIQATKTSLSSAKNITFIMDREGDIWEVYERLPACHVHLVVRAKQNRTVENEQGRKVKLKTALKYEKIQGQLDIECKDDDNKRIRTTANIKWTKCRIQVPTHKKGKSSVPMCCIEVKSESIKDKKADISWLIWTNHEVNNLADAKRVLAMYVKRWGIEVYFKLLKSDGYDIENCQLEKGPSIRKLTLLLMNSAMQTQQLKAARDGTTLLLVRDIFNPQEIQCLTELNEDLEGNTEKQKNPFNKDNLAWATWIIARLGGWKGYYTDKDPPGNKTLSTGLLNFQFYFMGYSKRK